jgi:hypothetical protein
MSYPPSKVYPPAERAALAAANAAESAALADKLGTEKAINIAANDAADAAYYAYYAMRDARS